MFFSRACQYAILAMIHLAAQDSGKRLSIRALGAGAGVPAPFLGKIIGTLVRAGLISARRGPNGGVALERAPAQVTVGDIVAAMDGAFDQRRCILGLPVCDDRHPCPLHQRWKPLEERLDTELHRLTLQQLAQAGPGGLGS